ncbi:MAG: hypothetical protein MUP36_00170, partial [Demequinaceae bacterium]|nr:hypothetical protein [Demequinaceae bacterium]
MTTGWMTKARTTVSAVVTMALLTSAVTVATVLASSSQAEAVPSGAVFNPGFIISDENFFDYDSMTVAEIQAFLNAKGPTTCTNCLREYRANTYAHAANPQRCVNAIQAKT